MKIIVVGAGEVGFHLIKMLSMKNHDVVVIETDTSKCQRVNDNLDAIAIEGSGASVESLLNAGAQDADIMVAVSSIDEVNIVACILANKLGIKTKIARVRNPEYTAPSALITPEQLGIDLMIHPEEETANEVVRLIKRSTVSEVIDFQMEGVQVMSIRIDSRTVPIAGKPLKAVTKEFPIVEFRTVAVLRNGRTIIPTGDDMIYFKDQIFVVAKVESVHLLLKIMGKAEARLSEVMILGGGKIGRRVAHELESDKDINVKLIESDRIKSHQIADKLKRTLVIQGDGTDIDLMATEGISEMDAYIALTQHDEENLISALLAKHLGVKRVIALVNKSDYLPIIPTIGLDAAVSKSLSTVDAILRYIRRGRILSVSTLKEIDAEVLEMVAQKDSRITKKPLKDLNLPRGVIIGAVLHNNSSHIPVGNTKIAPNDRVVVFALPEAITEIEKWF